VVAGAAVSSFIATATPDVGDPETCSATGPTATTCTITGLEAEEEYEVTVKAVSSAAGTESAESTAVMATPTGPPAPADIEAVTNVRGTALNNSVRVSWTLPEDTAGIDHFMAMESSGDGQCVTEDAEATSCVVPGLKNGMSYMFSVKSVAEGSAEDVLSDESPVVGLWFSLPARQPAANGRLGSSAGDLLPRGKATRVYGGGYRPNTPITLGIYAGVQLGRIWSTSTGNFSAVVRIPNVSLGRHTLVAIGLNSGLSTRTLARSIVVRPAATAAGGAALPGGPAAGPGTVVDPGTVFDPGTAAPQGGAALPATGKSLTQTILTGLGIMLAGMVAIACTYSGIAWRRRKVMRKLTPSS
jgi:hypothetical protein